MLGIVSDEYFEREIINCNVQIIDRTRGRGAVKEVPEIIREIIAEDAILSDKTAKQISEEHGISKSSISAYKHGATSTTTYNEPNERLAEHNNVIRNNIISDARSRLVSALQHITPDKLSEAKLRDVASVAKDMSVIIRNMEPDVIKDPNKENNVAFVFYNPPPIKEEVFDVVYSKE